MAQNTHTIVTVGRQLGSGGREIGKIIAEKLNLNYYDHELLAAASAESGLCKKHFEKADEKISSLSFGFNFQSCLSNDELFRLQSQTILKLAEEGPSLFIGRCANYILREYSNCFNLFVNAPLAWRIERFAKIQGISNKEAEDIITKTDKNRSAYYNYYTGQNWGNSFSYHFCVDSSKFGITETAAKIAEWI